MTNSSITKIRVSSIPLRDVIKDIAEEFGTTYSEEFGEYEVKVPSGLGEGFIRGINFENGLGLIIYECLFHKEMQISFIVDTIHPLKFLYIMEGRLDHSFENDPKINNLTQYQNAIVSSIKNHGHIIYFKAGVNTKLSSVEINLEEFNKKFENDINKLTDGIKELFVDVNTHASFYHEGYFSLKTADLFKEIEEFEKTEIIRKLFLEGMTYQILTQQIIEYLDDKKGAESRNVLRKYEIESIKKISNYVDSNLGETLTVDLLAQKAGMNNNKLQQGFKILYGDTVNTYIQKKRFDLAKDLMLNTDYTLSEIINRIGLSSKSYFSKIFREEYQMTPSEFRKKNKNSSNND